MMPHTMPPNGRVPVLGQRQQNAEQGVMQAMNSLSLSIFARIAAETLDPERPANPEQLRHLAKGSMIAARAYFEGLGVIERTGGPTPTDATADAQQTTG